MADAIRFSLDTDTLFRQFDQLGEEATRLVDAEAHAAATRVRVGWASRFSAQTRGTGQTAQNLRVDADRQRSGAKAYVVHALAYNRPDNLPIWFEFSTRYMRARPSAYPAARAEQQNFYQRIQAAIASAAKKAGF